MYSPEPAGHTKPCDCDTRHTSERSGLFVYMSSYEGWVFTDCQLRRQSPAAIYWAIERGLECHDGEPFVWKDCCPFCGKDLPQEPTITWRIDATGDPEL